MSKKQKTGIIITILISSFLLSITMFRSGLLYNFGLGFWGPNGHDGIWHLALINQLIQNVPPQNPIFSGTILSNYHWGYDFLVSIFSKITFISPSILYFQILPLLFAIILGFLSFKFAYLVTKNYKTSFFFVLLNYFASSFGWIVTLIKSDQIGGESLFWSMQSASTLLNPPFTLSLIILLSGLLLWIKHKNTNSIFYAFITGLVFSSLCSVKVYAGALIGISLALFWLIKLISTKKFSKFNFWICVFTGITSIVILYLLGVFNNSSLLEFKPLWFVHSMIESPDKFYWPKLASFRYNQTNIFISILVELSLICIFLIGNLGLRIFGFGHFIYSLIKQKKSDINLIFLIILTFSFLIPLLFVQKGTAWNTIQFFYYFLFFINFYLASFLSSLWTKNKAITFLILFFACFGSIATLKDYFGNPPPSSLPKNEINALTFLKSQSDGYVLTYPYNKYLKNNIITPIPLYAYETTAYVSAFSRKQVFLEDEMNLDITGFNWQTRRQLVDKFFTSTDKYFARGVLVDNNIKYIYLLDTQNISLSSHDLEIDEIYHHDGVRIYQVRR
jgi:hypothetical protein